MITQTIPGNADDGSSSTPPRCIFYKTVSAMSNKMQSGTAVM
jgi:hypothetical protein